MKERYYNKKDNIYYKNNNIDIIKKNNTINNKYDIDDKRGNKYEEIIPRSIYFECIWIIRDKKRLERILASNIDEYGEVERNAYYKLDAIHRAILKIPAEYRGVILRSITYGINNTNIYIHENTIKKYKREFIYQVAKNLALY